MLIVRSRHSAAGTAITASSIGRFATAATRVSKNMPLRSRSGVVTASSAPAAAARIVGAGAPPSKPDSATRRIAARIPSRHQLAWRARRGSP